MKKRLVFVLVTALAMSLAVTPALALSAADMEGIEAPETPGEVPAGLEITTLTEGETLRGAVGGCCPIVKTGPCNVYSPDAPCDMTHNHDELDTGIGFMLPVYVDIVHSLSVGVYDTAGAPKCGFYLGNTSPVEGYRDPAGLNGSDTAVLTIKSNDEYVKAVWANPGLMPIMCDDAGGPAWDRQGTGAATPLPLKLTVDGRPVSSFWVSMPHAVPPQCVTSERITLSVDKPDWQNEAGMYAGYVVIAAWQI